MVLVHCTSVVHKNVNIEVGTITELSLPVDICKQCRISFQMMYTCIQS